jgi:hypothetical protein
MIKVLKLISIGVGRIARSGLLLFRRKDTKEKRQKIRTAYARIIGELQSKLKRVLLNFSFRN